MKTSTKFIIGGAVVAGIVITAILIGKNKKDKKAEEEAAKKAADAAAGGKGAKPQPVKHGAPTVSKMLQEVEKRSGEKIQNGTVTVPFNIGQNRAVFYDNGRYAIFRSRSTGYIQKGNYLSGGRILRATDGRNKGESFNNTSVERNLKASIK